MSVFSAFVKRFVYCDKDCLHKFFLQTPCCVTEKYDGTNIAKDDEGNIYSRRFLLDAGQESFIKTSLKKVIEAKINEFKNKILEIAGLDSTIISKCIVYGELICNPYYDYRQRDIMGDWKVFGAILILKKNILVPLKNY